MKKTIFVDFHGFTGKFTFSSVVLLLLFFMQIVSKTTYMFMFSSKKQNEISLPFPCRLMKMILVENGKGSSNPIYLLEIITMV